jgi:hypothetical protein
MFNRGDGFNDRIDRATSMGDSRILKRHWPKVVMTLSTMFINKTTHERIGNIYLLA